MRPNEGGLGERLSNKLQLACHKNPIQNVLVDWLVNGSVDEKNDVNNVLSNCEEALKLVNGLNHKLNPDFKQEHFYAELNKIVTDDIKHEENNAR